MELSNQRLLLRAELAVLREELVTYAYDLAPTSVFVVTDRQAPRGTPVRLRLTFLDVIEPIELAGFVEGVRSSGNPGDQAGLHVVFDEDPRVVAVLARLQRALATPTSTRRRVMLIEDSGFTREMYVYGLLKSAEGAFEIDHAEDVEHAWQYLAEQTYDLVVVDYFLPTATGAELVARLRSDDRFASVPIVALSVGGPGARDAMLAAGADLFLDKPLALRDLATTLKLLSLRGTARTTGKSILVLDDSPVVLALMRSALESAGYRVEVAADLSSFERQRTAFTPDLILLDVQMPEAFGDDVAITLRGRLDVRVPILLVSSLDEDELAKRARAASADGYITKAAGMSALVRRCKEILEGTA